MSTMRQYCTCTPNSCPSFITDSSLDIKILCVVNMLLYYNLYYKVLYYASLHYTAWYQERIMSKKQKLKALLMVPIYNYVYSLPVLVITGIKDLPL